jgi:hypothetical protein
MSSLLDQSALTDLADRLVAAARRAGADAADALAVRSVSLAVEVREGAVEESERSEGDDVGLRVFLGSRQAVVSTNDIKTDVALLAERAVAMARAAPDDPFAGLADPALLAHDVPDLDLLDPNLPTVAQLEERAQRAESAGLAVKGVTKSGGASASAGIGGMVLVTSSGFRGAYLNSGQSVSMTAIVGEGTAMERDYDYSSAIHGADLEPPEKVGRTAGERTVERLNPRKVETKRVPVVFDRRIAGSLVGHLASAINAAAVARKTSFLKDKLGERLFKPGIHVIDDPRRLRGLRSRPFDAEGVATKRLAVVVPRLRNRARTRARDHWPCPARRVVDPFTGTEQSSSFRRRRYARCIDGGHCRWLLRHRPHRHGRQPGDRRLQPRRVRLLDREWQAQLSRQRGDDCRKSDRHVQSALTRERSRVPFRYQRADRARGGTHRWRSMTPA